MRRNRFFRALGLAVLITTLAVATSTYLRAGTPAAPPDTEASSFEAKVDALFAKWNSLDTPGAAVAVVKDGLVVYRKGFGCAQLEYGIPITPSTVFHVASVSKQFTAMAITMLEEAGKLSATDDIRKYLPELADFGKTITIRHLLNHTSGLRDQWDLLILSGWRMDDVITQEDIMGRLRRQKELNFPPGDQYLYSNSGFTLLAEIVGRVSGRPFTDWTRDNIFRPLGMTSTHFHLDHQEIVKNRAYSYDGEPGKGFTAAVLNYANVGATSLFTTVEDMVNWLRNFDEKRVGGAAVIDRMLTKGVLNGGKEIPYARGIMVDEYKGLKCITHSGGDAGFRSDVVYFPAEKFGVAVFSNLASFAPGTMTRRIADIYLAGKFGQAAANPPGAKAGATPGEFALPAKSLEAYVGTYWFEANQNVREVVVDKGKLFYVRSAENRSELVPVSPTEFRIKESDDVRFVFSDKAGKGFETMTVLVSNNPSVIGKRMEPFKPSENDLKEYAGRYYSDELDTRYDLTVRSGALVVRLGQQEPIPSEPQKKDVFSVAGFARIQFQRDAGGAITGFLVTTGRVRNLKFVRMAS